jgi:OmpA-OmpF porin, OOP family
MIRYHRSGYLQFFEGADNLTEGENKMKILQSFLALAMAVLLLGACAPKVTTPYSPLSAQRLAESDYQKRVDNFLVVLDASSSMAQPAPMGTRYQMAQGLASSLNETLPELDWQAGLRIYGPRFENVPSRQSALVYGMTRYNRVPMASALQSVTEPAGTTPMAAALRQAGGDLAGLSGESALVIFSDGEADSPDEVLQVASVLRERFDGRLCVYPVLVGDSRAGAALMKELVERMECGFVSRADELSSGEAMTAFAEKVLVEKVDRPPVVAPPAPVVVAPPVVTKVEPVFITETRRLEVHFAFDRAEVRPSEHEALARFADFLKRHPEITAMEISGHTCNMGPAEYNQRLSERRAESVVKYLVENFGIDRQRLTARGYGLTRPQVSNDTLAGRQQNRRVEAVATAMVEKK